MALDMSISGLRDAYKAGDLTPSGLMQEIREQARLYEDHNIWITLFNEEQTDQFVSMLHRSDIDQKPLWGIPFAIKDNIDLAGVPTTAGCEAYTTIPDESATVVNRLLSAGAIPVGKANLDQFATGLNGTRSPWGACRNSFNKDYISGGSSAGSAVSVALGLATFSLGTDTAGSGRVPACFNNLIGLKPTRGLVPASGVVPACQSLDCVSIFACNADDANSVLQVAEGFDSADPYSRANVFDNTARHYGHYQGQLKVGVIPSDQLEFFEDASYKQAYEQTLATLQQQNFELTEMDYRPFIEVAKLLYEGPWVTERYIACQPLIDESPEALHDTVRAIIEPGGSHAASALFKAQYRLAELKHVCSEQLSRVECLITPSAGRLFTVKEMLEEPIKRNSELGYYTNFVNLLDMAAVSVPTKITDQGLPFGITLVAGAMSDRRLLSLANKIQQAMPLDAGATGNPQPVLSSKAVGNSSYTDLVVCGAHMENLPLNWQLTERGATLKKVTSTDASYRLYRLPGESPGRRPALVVSQEGGVAIDIEVWSIPTVNLGSFVAGIPAPLGLGKVTLADGQVSTGFICEHGAIDGCEDISSFQGWRGYLVATDPD